MSEIRLLEWVGVNFENRRVVWPDSKTGDISEPMSQEVYRMLSRAYGIEGSPYVCPSVFNGTSAMPEGTYWTPILTRAKVPHVGAHGIRHRAVAGMANSGVSAEIGTALTAHKTATMFMRYMHAEDDPVRAAAEKVANRRWDTIASNALANTLARASPVEPTHTCTSPGNYRPLRHRKAQSPAVPLGPKRASMEQGQNKPEEIAA